MASRLADCSSDGRRWVSLTAGAVGAFAAGACSTQQPEQRASEALPSAVQPLEQLATSTRATAAWPVAETINVARGAEPVCRAPSGRLHVTAAGVARGDREGDFAAQANAAQGLVGQLSQTRWAETREVAAEILDVLAEALEAGGPRPVIQRQLEEIRFQAERLRRTDGTPFARGSWVKSALRCAIVALEHGSPCRHADSLAPWLENARSAIDTIDGGASLGFQPVITQDAFRSVADAFLAAAQTRVLCF